MKKQLLWISLCPVSKSINHAGGKALYKHIKAFQESELFEIKIISFCDENELNELRLEPQIDNLIINTKRNLIEKIIDIESKYNLFNKNASYIKNSQYIKMKRSIKQIERQGYIPDIVILNWTEMLALAAFVKKIFPKSKLVMIEEDVSFLKRERAFKNADKVIEKIFYKVRYIRGKKKEIEWINYADLVATYSNKDAYLLEKENIPKSKIFVFSPVFSDMSYLTHKEENQNILFWGAMSRRENYLSAIWFINNVMPLLNDLNIKFVIIGANPPSELQALGNNRIVITGFVKEPAIYFKTGMCMVVPLIQGAGIKIKVLEGLSSGIPVISNAIGIEGIGVGNSEYIHAETPEEFSDAIKKIYYKKEDVKSLSDSAQKYIKRNFNELESIETFIEKVKGDDFGID